MARLTGAARAKMPKSSFVFGKKAPGSGSYPIPDESHARDALARSSGKAANPFVKKKVAKKFPGIKIAGK